MHDHPRGRFGLLGLPELQQIGVGLVVEVAGGDTHVGKCLAGFSLSGQSVDLALLWSGQRSTVKHEHLVRVGLPAFQGIAEHRDRTGFGHNGHQDQCDGGLQ